MTLLVVREGASVNVYLYICISVYLYVYLFFIVVITMSGQVVLSAVAQGVIVKFLKQRKRETYWDSEDTQSTHR
jgi:hypothetical protein